MKTNKKKYIKKNRSPFNMKSIFENTELFDDDNFITEDEDNDDDDNGDTTQTDSEIDDTTLRIDAMKYSMKIAKMVDNCQIEDVINISDLVYKYLRDFTPGCDIDKILGLKKDDSSSENENKKYSDEDEDNSDTAENAEDNSSDDSDSDEDLTPEDLDDDFTIDDDDKDDSSKSEDNSTNEESTEVPDQFII